MIMTMNIINKVSINKTTNYIAAIH